MTQPPESPLNRYLRILGGTTDLTLLVLRGHLLIEEQLQALIERAVRDAAPLDEARLTFAQKSRLAQAVLGPPFSTDALWYFIGQLNRLRNRLSHSAEVASLESDVDALNRLSEAAAEAVVPPSSERANRLAIALASAGGSLDMLTAHVSRPQLTPPPSEPT